MQSREPARQTRPYGAFRAEEMILRDYLAADRTILANERTLLSYIRTALASAGGGVALIHFLEGPVFETTGILLIVAGFGTVAFGAVRYRQMRRRISVLGEPPTDENVRSILQANKDENV
ncbi:MAG: DUF202 domain-containing protein [Chloroflexota bacterium]